MKKARVVVVLFGFLAATMINCGEKSNPTGPNSNSQNTASIDCVKVKVIVHDTVQIGIDHYLRVIINKPELVDEIIEIDSGAGNIVTTGHIYKNEIGDTSSLISTYSYEDVVETTVKWVVGNQSRDTEFTMYVMDTIPVDVQSGSFGPKTLSVGDSLYLYVQTDPFTNVPYTCQWLKDGQKVGDTIYAQGSSIVAYRKGNITMADSGAYAINLYRAHSNTTVGGMQVHVIAKQ